MLKYDPFLTMNLCRRFNVPAGVKKVAKNKVKIKKELMKSRST